MKKETPDAIWNLKDAIDSIQDEFMWALEQLDKVWELDGKLTATEDENVELKLKISELESEKAELEDELYWSEENESEIEHLQSILDENDIDY